MGGHGGLNILPQKKWNVYNRDNRLKVARDEAAYEQKQEDLAEKHNAAEREHRRLALKQRARQRHAGAATINLDEIEEPSMYIVGQEHQLEEEASQPHLGGTVADPISLSFETNAVGSYDTNTARPAVEGEKPRKSLPLAKRQKKEKNVQKKKEKRQPPPSLAELARQLDTAPLSTTVPQSLEEEEERAPAIATINTELQKKHINLFEEEEARAKNPEKAAEQRALLAKRGDVKTHTSDARFDESFQLGYGLGGGGSDMSAKGSLKSGTPWYAQRPSSLNIAAAGTGAMDEESLQKEKRAGQNRVYNDTTARVMEKWKEEGRAALITAAAGTGNSKDEKEEEEMKFLLGVKVIPPEAEKDDEEAEKDKLKRHRKKKEKKQSSRSKNESKEDIWSKLREERLRREQEEQKRQKEAVREATVLDGGRRRYFSTYGYGK